MEYPVSSRMTYVGRFTSIFEPCYRTGNGSYRRHTTLQSTMRRALQYVTCDVCILVTFLFDVFNLAFCFLHCDQIYIADSYLVSHVGSLH